MGHRWVSVIHAAALVGLCVPAAWAQDSSWRAEANARSEDILAHPEVIKQRLDKVAGLGLPIWITEFDVADANEKANADKLELVYRTVYSHPAVEGIIAWIFWAGNSWRGPNAGLAKRDWTLNGAGKRFEALMFEESTNAAGTTDSSGVFALPAFPGDYAATLTAPGQPAARETFTLPPGKGPQVIILKVTMRK